jgi:hypothetical protein
MRGLVQGIQRGGLPLKSVPEKTLRLVLAMLALRIVGYRQVLSELNSTLFGGGLQRKRLKTISMLRVMELIGQLFELYRYLSIAPSSGLWLLFNRYYAIGEVDRILDISLGSIDGNESTTLAMEFKIQVLLVPINVHDFRHSQLSSLRSSIKSFCHLVEVGRTGDVDSPGCFCFSIVEDAPPSRFEATRQQQCQLSENLRTIDLAPLTKVLENILIRDDTPGISASAEYAIKKLVARKLIAGWKIISDARAQRSEQIITVRLARGLSNITAIIALQDASMSLANSSAAMDAPASVVADEDDIFAVEIEGLDSELHSEQMVEEDDVWRQAYISVKPVSRHWVDSFRGQSENEVLEGRLLNVSEHGYGIAVSAEEKTSGYMVGNLLAVELEGQWQLAFIRWIRPQPDAVWMGLARLGGDLRPRNLVIRRNGNDSQPMPVLLIIHDSGQPAIVLHNLNLNPSENITFGNHANRTFGDLLDSTPHFECYRLEPELHVALQEMVSDEADEEEEVTELYDLTDEQIRELVSQSKRGADSAEEEIIDDAKEDVWASFRNE